MHQFCCEKDESVQYFLQNKAIDFEVKNKSRTFFIINEEEFCKGNLIILGYFSLALKVLTVPDEISNRKRILLDGLSAKFKGKPILHFPVYLIGQLAKNDMNKDQIEGNEIMSFAIDIIKEAQKNVGGRVVLIECNDNKKLKKFYSDTGFEIINKDNEDNQLQMISYL